MKTRATHECCTPNQLKRDAVALAEAACAARGLNFTPQRREVLTLLANSPHPLGAYDLLERMTVEGGRRPAPVTAYRALEFLTTNGFAHRIESRNAFMACHHGHKANELVVLMICENCGCASEVSAAMLMPQIDAVAAQMGFKPGSRVVEMFGRCEHCP